MTCAHCGHNLDAVQATAGTTILCPQCGKATAESPALDGGPATLADSVPTPPPALTPTVGPTPSALLGVASATVASAFSFLDPAQAPDELGRLAHYRVLKLLGQGGMGKVFLAEDVHLQRQVALKVLPPELVTQEDFRQRFLREAKATASLRSDHIVIIHQVGEHNRMPFLAMEYLVGSTLGAWLGQTPLPTPAQTVDFGLQMARGLDAAHRSGLVHRDIKPANIWVESPSGRVKILDFGLVRPAEDSARLTQTGMVMGTPAYMAPEQADGTPLDARADLFSLGCVLYEMAAGEPPFTGSSTIAILKATALKEPRPLHELNPSVPAALASLIKRLLAKKPQDRPESAAEVIAELEAIAAEHHLLEPRKLSGAYPRRPAPAQHSRRQTVAIIAGLALIVGAAIWMAFGRTDPHGTARPPRPTFRGVTDDTIRLGMSAPFSGPSKELGREMEIGLRTYFRHVNEQLGGVNGRKLDLVVLDDGYEPDRALANVQELFDQRQIFAVVGNVGTPTAQKTLPYALEKEMLFFGAFTGAPLLRKSPPDRFVFNYRASYEEETAAIIEYFLQVRQIKPDEIAVFAQQDGYGDAGFQGVARVLRRHNHDPKDTLRVGHARNSSDVNDAVETILQHPKIRAVVMVSTYKPAAKFIQRLKDAKRDLLFSNVSFVGSLALSEELGPAYAKDVIVTQVVPPITSQSTAVRNYRQHLKTFYPNEPATFVSLEGYLDAVILVEALRRAGDHITTDSVIDALESIHNFDIGLGAPINYGQSDHQASDKVWGTILDEQAKFQPLDLN
ncbi:MAG: ABC transporter substrate-binding protein [Planctomycetia bacterium]|nr:ABC transporter substrate-binding protein [Planctomycetia bacterium]